MANQYPLEFRQAFREQFGPEIQLEEFIPPVFCEMSGDSLSYDPNSQTLTARFHNLHQVLQGLFFARAKASHFILPEKELP